MTQVVPDPDFEARVRANFARQQFMATIGARLEHVARGEVAIALSFRDDLTQQHGFLHAGVVTSVVDSACGYAALTVMAPGAAVLSVPGAHFHDYGKAARAGRKLGHITITGGDPVELASRVRALRAITSL